MTRGPPLAHMLERSAARHRGWIRTAGTAGILHGLFQVFRYFTGPDPVGTVALGPIDSFLMAAPMLVAAGVGTLLKRPTAALALLATAVGLQLTTWIAAGRLTNLIPAILIIAVYQRGWSAARAWHTSVRTSRGDSHIASAVRRKPGVSGSASHSMSCDGPGHGEQ